MSMSDQILVSWDGLKWFKHDRGICPREKNVLRTIQSLTNKNSVFVDVGAHIGFYTVRLALKCKHVHAVEPNPESAYILRRNIELNNINNVTVHQCACGKNPSKAKIYIADTCTTLIPRTNRRTVEVDVKPLDSLVKYCDVVKIDVEGFEEEVLLGAKNLITHVKPIWIIEHHDKGLGIQYYPETKGMSERIRKLLSDYIKITYDEGRSAYIHKSKINQVPEHALRRLIALGVQHHVLTNIIEGRAWYHGLPYTWWYGVSMLDFMEEVYEHVIEEPEWIKIVEK